MIAKNHLNIIIGLICTLIVIALCPIIFTSRVIGNYGDIFSYYYPLKFHALTGLHTGHIPLWNPYIFAGTPFLANMQSSIFYPGGILFYIIPLIRSFSLFFTLHLFLGSLGMFFLLKQWLKYSSISLYGSILFSFAPFLLLKIPQGHPVHFAGYCLTPWVLLFMRASFKRHATYATFMVTALVLALQFLSGHIQPIFITVIFIIVYSAFHYKQIRLTMIIIPSLFLLLISVQLLPTVQYAFLSHRQAWNFVLAASYSLPWKSLISILFPFWYGNPQNGTFIDQMHPSIFFENYSLYIGLLPCVLAVVGLYALIKKRQVCLVFILFFSLILALGDHTPLYYYAYRWFPGFSILRVPARFYLLTLICIVCCSSAGFRHMSFLRKSPSLAILLVLFTFLSLYLPYRKYIYTLDQNTYLNRTRISRLLDAYSPDYRLTTDGNINNPNKSMLYHHYNIAGYDALILKNYFEYINRSHPYPVVDTVRVNIKNYRSPLLRSLSGKLYLSPESIPHVKPLMSSDNTHVYQAGISPKRFYFAQRSIMLADKEKIINYMNSSLFLVGNDILQVNSRQNVTLHTNNNRILNTVSTPDKITVTTLVDRPSWLVFTDAFIPGWHAYTNGMHTPVHESNYLSRGVWISEPGHNTIQMLYRPRVFRYGMYITIVSLIFLLLALQLHIINLSLSYKKASEPANRI